MSEVIHGVPKLATHYPIEDFVTSIQKQPTIDRRLFRLQALLFLINRHWTALHANLQNAITSALIPWLSNPAEDVASWAFLCLAAVAHSPAPTASKPDPSAMQVDSSASSPPEWENIWGLALRRGSRASAHLCTLLLGPNSGVPSQRTLSDIEVLARDIALRGASDAACAFLARCIGVAGADARLYRMALEDTVLGWLAEQPLCSGAGGMRDVLGLLEAVCAIGRKGDSVVHEEVLPECELVRVMLDECRASAVRDFVLHARLPTLRPNIASPEQVSASLPTDFSDLVQPRARERKATAHLLKTLEALPASFDVADQARRGLDIAVLALCFEGTLERNGTRSTRGVVKAACKVVGSVFKSELWVKLTWDERALVLDALGPLLGAEGVGWEEPWEVLVRPGKDSGIERGKLRMLQEQGQARREPGEGKGLQRAIWRSADVSLKVSVVSLRADVVCNTGSGRVQSRVQDAARVPSAVRQDLRSK